MAQRADVIRRDIEDTRAAMTVKLAMLEGRVMETVAGAQASVEKIMEDVVVFLENPADTEIFTKDNVMRLIETE